MSFFALHAHLNPADKILYDFLAFFPCDRFYCCYYFCFRVRNTLEVVEIDPLLNLSQEIKMWGGLSLVSTATTAGHTYGLSDGQKTAALTMP